MTRFVIDPSIAIKLLEDDVAIASAHEILAPTLLRSQVLEQLFQRVKAGDLGENAALGLNTRFAKLKFRYLGDAVLRQRAWSIARAQNLASTFDAEYIALTQLQADALVTSNMQLAKIAKGLVNVQPFSALRG